MWVLAAAALAAAPDGARIFAQACAPCHGATGAGDGPAARGLDPAPRDLALGVYRFRSTRTGAAPTDDDLRRTVDLGLPGTSMPAWRGLLSEAERDAVVAYVRSLSPIFAEEVWDDDLLVVEAELSPPPATPEAVAAGERVYARMQCAKCHGPDGRGNPDNALTDDLGRPIRAFDFTRGAYKGGGRAVDVYRSFTTGLDGSPMPSYADSLAEEERWQLVAYVASLRRPPGLWGWLFAPPTANHPPPDRAWTAAPARRSP